MVLAYGAEGDRRLGVPGEDLGNVFSAREFVGWYNGQPDCAALPVTLDQEHAVVIGHGNVALDIARILLTPVDRLRQTDIADHALEALAFSRVRNIDVIGRRGPLQVAFTIKELRELVTLAGVRVVVRGADRVLATLEASRAAWQRDRARKRLMELIEKTARASLADAGEPWEDRQWTLRFQESPLALLPDTAGARVAGVRLQRTVVDPETGRAEPGEGTVDAPAGLAVRSVGYRSLPVPGVPFDPRHALVPNVAGRVVAAPAPDAAVIPGLYVSGWLKSGPVGVIASTLGSAHETADAVLADFAASEASGAAPAARPGWLALAERLRAANVPVVTTRGWQAIDEAERRLGRERGIERVKLVSTAAMLQTAHATPP